MSRPSAFARNGTSVSHSGRKHSKFSASGAERYEKCPGSVKLSEGMPDKSSIYSEEGTKAHEVVDILLNRYLNTGSVVGASYPQGTDRNMVYYALHTVKFIIALYEKTPHSTLMVETRVVLDFIHKEAFGTFDSAIVDHFGMLHVFDFKYGAGVSVSVIENLQMIFYGLGLAYQYQWNFKTVRLWIIQPRIPGYNGPVYWDVPILELKQYWQDRFRQIITRVENEPETFVEGGHCHWCRCRSKCPLKQEKRVDKLKEVFINLPSVG